VRSQACESSGGQKKDIKLDLQEPGSDSAEFRYSSACDLAPANSLSDDVRSRKAGRRSTFVPLRPSRRLLLLSCLVFAVAARPQETTREITRRPEQELQSSVRAPSQGLHASASMMAPAATIRGTLQSYMRDAGLGDPVAQTWVGYFYANGIETAADAKQAVRWFLLAAASGYDVAEFDLGLAYMNGDGVRQDDAEALRWFSKAAEKHNRAAEANLGYLYGTGRGVQQDCVKALKFFARSESLSPVVQFDLSRLYQSSCAGQADFSKANYWLEKAAQGGFGEAQYDLALRSLRGDGMPHDERLALAWLTKAASQHHVLAEFVLGLLYSQGTAVSQDFNSAAHWYREAVHDNYAPAANNLAAMLYLHPELHAQPSEVAWLYRFAAERGIAESAFVLGKFYEAGFGVPQDSIEATNWYRKAAENGSAPAKQRLDGIQGGGHF
jgi:uncharacterized protein